MIASGSAGQSADHQRTGAAEPTTRLHALLLCDLVDSTGLIERLGDGPAAELIRQHDRLARDCLQRHGGREIDKTDGFLLLFERPIQAVAFALDYTDALQHLAEASRQPLRARVGIHVGEVLLWRNAAADIADGAKPVEVEGLAKAIAARLMGLARPGQILLSDTARMLAQRAAGELGSERTPTLRWLAHGRYRLKGVDAPLPVHEVGVRGHAPLRAPASTDKARRLLPWWKTRWAQAAAVLAVLCIPLAMLMRPEPAIAFQERDWIVVASLRNLTENRDFDGAFDVAVRVSLEQSRYVNAMSATKMQDALERMRSSPDVEVDRDMASELALREGARAVLVPTLAETGGRLRVSAELVEPASGVTVYSRSADAKSAADSLKALDEVLRSLRQDLGESISSIEASAQPLSAVTTADIDALRAYSLAMDAKRESRFAQARALAEHALTLDPEFAMAHSMLGALDAIAGNSVAAKRHLELAVDLADRLTNREMLFVRAMLASLSDPVRIEPWQALVEIYPDHHSAHYNLAWFALRYRRDFEFAVKAIEPALVAMNPRRASAYYLRGAALLAQDRIDDALHAFEAAHQFGVGGDRRDQAYAYAARRDFDSALQVLRDQSETGLDVQQEWDRLAESAIAIDQGRWSVLEQSARATCSDLTAGGVQCRTLALIAAWLLGVSDRAALVSLISDVEAKLPQTPSFGDDELLDVIGICGWIAARTGAEDALDRASAILSQHAEPALQAAELHRLVQAEHALSTGDAIMALNALGPTRSGETFLASTIRARAHLAAGQAASALEIARRNVAQPGRAYADTVGSPWVMINLSQLNDSLRIASRAAEATGDHSLAAELSAEFTRRWPGPLPAALALSPAD